MDQRLAEDGDGAARGALLVFADTLVATVVVGVDDGQVEAEVDAVLAAVAQRRPVHRLDAAPVETLPEQRENIRNGSLKPLWLSSKSNFSLFSFFFKCLTWSFFRNSEFFLFIQKKDLSLSQKSHLKSNELHSPISMLHLNFVERHSFSAKRERLQIQKWERWKG